MDNRTIKESIRACRIAANMSQSEMARTLGIHISTYKKLEMTGKTALVHDQIDPIARVFGIAPEKLVCGYMPPKVGEMAVRDEGNDENALLVEQIQSLRDEIASLREALEDKDTIIKYLKKEVDGKGENV